MRSKTRVKPTTPYLLRLRQSPFSFKKEVALRAHTHTNIHRIPSPVACTYRTATFFASQKRVLLLLSFAHLPTATNLQGVAHTGDKLLNLIKWKPSNIQEYSQVVQGCKASEALEKISSPALQLHAYEAATHNFCRRATEAKIAVRAAGTNGAPHTQTPPTQWATKTHQISQHTQ